MAPVTDVIGTFLELVEERQMFTPQTRLFVQIGLLGSFTTFSTLGYETVMLIKSQEFGLALGNVGANAILGVAAVAGGMFLVRLLP